MNGGDRLALNYLRDMLDVNGSLEKSKDRTRLSTVEEREEELQDPWELPGLQAISPDEKNNNELLIS